MAAPATSETWLAIADLVLHLRSEDERLALPESDLARAFVVTPRRADVELRSRWADRLDEPQGDLLFDGGDAWQLRRAGDGFVFTFRSSSGDRQPYKRARFSGDFASGDVELLRARFDDPPLDRVDPLAYPLDELLMIHLLSRGKGVAIHASGLVDAAGRAFVFAGQSGAGKSTLARLWAGEPGVTMLSDERLVLRTDGDRVLVHGTPWHGDAGMVSPRSGTLAGIYFLHHAPDHSIVPVPAPLASARVLACAFLPFHSRDAVQETIAAVARAVSSAPCYELRFAPDRSVVGMLTASAGMAVR